MTDCPIRGGGLPSPVVGWIRNYAVNNYWRVAAFYELDDLCQDGLLCAVKCRNRYGTGILDSHYMALVQVSFSRHLIDLTRRHLSAGELVYLADLGDEVTVWEKYSPVEYPLGELVRCIEELPNYLYGIIKCLLTDPAFRINRSDKHDIRRFLCDC